MELIEAYGTGILKIMSAYEGTGLMPQIEASDNAFKIIYLNMNAKAEQKKTVNTGYKTEKCLQITILYPINQDLYKLEIWRT